MTLAQSGTSLAGTAAITGLGSGSLVGSILNQSLVITMNELSPCLGILVAVADNATATSASGTFTGSDCNGQTQGTFALTKP